MASKQIVSIFYIFFFIVIVIAISRVFRGGKDADVCPTIPPVSMVRVHFMVLCYMNM